MYLPGRSVRFATRPMKRSLFAPGLPAVLIEPFTALPPRLKRSTICEGVASVYERVEPSRRAIAGPRLAARNALGLSFSAERPGPASGPGVGSGPG